MIVTCYCEMYIIIPPRPISATATVLTPFTEAVGCAEYINVHKYTRETQAHIIILVLLGPVERRPLRLEKD